jgi:hypothetical protein
MPQIIEGKRGTVILVLLGSAGLFVMCVYLFSYHLDYFINKRMNKGNFRIQGEYKGVIKLAVNYYDDYQKKIF